MSSSSLFRLTGLSVALMSAMAAHGQDSSDISIERMIVTTKATAPSTTKGDFSLLKAPQNIQILSKNFLDDQGVVHLEDALKNVAGIQPGGYYQGYDYFRIRGFDASQNIYLDGLRLNDNGLGANVEQSNLETLEVMKGPSSTLYGAGAISGMVNLVTKRPTQTDMGSISLQGGNLGYRELDADINRVLSDDGEIFGRVGLAYREAANSVDHIDGQNRFFIAPSLTFNLGEDAALTLLTSYTKDDNQLGMPLPAMGTVLQSPLGQLNKDLFYGNIKDPGAIKDETYRLGYELRWDLTDSLQLRQNVRFQDASSDWHNLYYPSSYNADTGDLNLYKFSYRTQWKTWALDTGLNGRFMLGETEHLFTAGVDIFISDLYTSGALGSDFPTINLYQPDYSVFPDTEVNQFGPENKVENRILGLYAQDQINLGDHWSFTLGARFDRYKQAYVDDYETKLSPRAGVSYAFNDDWVAFASYSEAFTPQSYVDSNGKVLDPEEGQQWELGLKSRAFNGDLNATVSLYELTKKNIALANVDAGGNFTYSASGELQSRGIELDLQWLLTQDLQLIGHGAYTHAVDTEHDKWVANVPRYAVGGWLKYNLDDMLDGLSVAAGVNHYGKQQGNVQAVLTDSSEGDFYLPSYTLVDLNLTYSWDQYDLRFIVNNLNDEDYFSGSDSLLRVLPGSGREVKLSFTANW
ncbi:TonB-dependent siderophore receptor [Shewanella zhangzhouensis]|uniref:TonB-dependent siderophore receptor n=1 Tax=Shewanella zhangzhouensis TaxID=2864213 RepID=UPI001C660EE3|nr:TonB-dependent receptor [Shewanella zhangzhouensis]QYK05038.1 TonB-dependent receptor [Shewanella zhangzhouensis]